MCVDLANRLMRILQLHWPERCLTNRPCFSFPGITCAILSLNSTSSYGKKELVELGENNRTIWDSLVRCFNLWLQYLLILTVLYTAGKPRAKHERCIWFFTLSSREYPTRPWYGPHMKRAQFEIQHVKHTMRTHETRAHLRIMKRLSQCKKYPFLFKKLTKR